MREKKDAWKRNYCITCDSFRRSRYHYGIYELLLSCGKFLYYHAPFSLLDVKVEFHFFIFMIRLILCPGYGINFSLSMFCSWTKNPVFSFIWLLWKIVFSWDFIIPRTPTRKCTKLHILLLISTQIIFVFYNPVPDVEKNQEKFYDNHVSFMVKWWLLYDDIQPKKQSCIIHSYILPAIISVLTIRSVFLF